jgi:hypothetical protein
VSHRVHKPGLILSLAMFFLLGFLSTGWAADLKVAAQKGDLEKVRQLLERGADVNQIFAGGQTALYYAARGGHVEVAGLLLSQGAKVNAGKPASPLHAAAENGQEKMVRLLLANGATVSRIDLRNGFTPLHSAVKGGHVGVVKILLANNAEVNAKDFAGNTPLNVAAATGHTDIALALMGNNADLSANKRGVDPVNTARLNNHHDLYGILLAYQKKTMSSSSQPLPSVPGREKSFLPQGPQGQKGKSDGEYVETYGGFKRKVDPQPRPGSSQSGVVVRGSVEKFIIFCAVLVLISVGPLWIAMKVMGVSATFWTVLLISFLSSVIGKLAGTLVSIIPGGTELAQMIALVVMINLWTDADIWPQSVVIAGIAVLVYTLVVWFLIGSLVAFSGGVSPVPLGS